MREMKRLLKWELKVFETRFLRIDHDSIDWDDLAVVRHETALAKVPFVVEYAAELLDGGVRKIVIFAHHRDVIARLVEGLSRFNPVILVGGMVPQARQNSIDAFQGDPSVRIFIGNIQAAGTGITLAPASSVCLFAELSWVPAEMTQCEDRLHRIGTKGFRARSTPRSRGIARCDDGQGSNQEAKGPGRGFELQTRG